jgi:hypothetical protein
VEYGAGGPLDGLVSFRILQASTHSAASRAGTVHDGNILTCVSKSLHLPSGMVDPLSRRTVPKSPAEPIGHQNFAFHPATSARTRCIHRASVHQRFRCQGMNFRNARADTAVRHYTEFCDRLKNRYRLVSTNLPKAPSSTNAPTHPRSLYHPYPQTP